MVDQKSSSEAQDLTRLLRGLNAGDAAAADEIVPLVYAELRRLAAHYLKSERDGHTLQPTALVHEAYLRLIRQEAHWQNRTHFFAVAANLMRRILVDYARAYRAGKRGGAAEQINFDEAFVFVRERPDELVALDEALERLAEIDPRRARVVELKFFAGLTNDEIAHALGVHPNTAARDWHLARAWLKTQMKV